MKYLIKTILGTGLVVGVVSFGLALDPEKPVTCSDLQEIHDAQTTALLGTGKYSQFSKSELPKNIRVNEYQTSKGERGYEIFCEDASGFYSVGVGAEAAVRTSFEPRLPEPIATST